jgi:hypothetical protein
MKMSHEEYKNATKRQKEWLDEMKMPTVEEMLADMPTDAEFRAEILRDLDTIAPVLKKR